MLPVDRFGPTVEQDGWALTRSPELALRVARRLGSGGAPVDGAVLTGRGPELDGPVVLAVAEVVAGSTGT